MGELSAMLDRAERPVAIIGGADWNGDAAHDFAGWAAKTGIPVAAAFRRQDAVANHCPVYRSEEHTSELQSLMRSSYAVFCLKTKIYNRHVGTQLEIKHT